MAISERLSLLVTLDAQGAIKGFNDIGKAADKNLSKADEKLDRMASRFQKAGAGMIATSGLAAVGLFKAGQAAGDLEQAVGGTAAVFGRASGAIDDYAKKAAQAAGLSESAFRQATTSIGGQLKGLGFGVEAAADQAINLTQVAADLAATYGGTTAEAVQALGAALRGEADPAERFNLYLNQTRVNAKAVEMGLAATTAQVDANAKAQATLALILEQSADAQGQFAREADTAQGSMARFQAEAENLKAAIGSAVAPVLGQLADGVGGLLQGFNELDPATQSIVSRFALFGTGAVGVAGALSFTTGKVIDARDHFGDFKDMLFKSEGGLSRFGQVTTGITAAVGLFALAMFKAQQDAAKLREASRKLREEAEDTGKSLNEVAIEGLAKTFAESDQVSEAMDTLGVSFKDLSGPLTGTKKEFEDFTDAMTQEFIEKGTSPAGRAAITLRDRVAALRDPLMRAREESTRTSDATAELGIAMETSAPKAAGLTEEIDEQKAALDLTTESARLFKEGMEAAFGDLTIEEAADRRAQALRDLGDRFADASEAVKTARERIGDLTSIPVADRSDSYARDLADAQAQLAEAIDLTSRSLDGNSESALQNREDLRGLVEDIAAIIELRRDEGASLEDLETIRALERENLARTLEAMGFAKEEIARYVEAIDAIPLTKDTTITADTAPAEIALSEALKRMQRQIDLNPMSIDVAFAEKFASRAASGRAIGGPVSAGSSYLVNEYGRNGPEIFTPAVNGTISPGGGLGGGTTIDQTVNIYNPVPEPISESARRLRQVRLDMAS